MSGFEHEWKEIKGNYGNNSPKQLYEFSYSLFKSEDNESLQELNIIIKNSVIENADKLGYTKKK